MRSSACLALVATVLWGCLTAAPVATVQPARGLELAPAVWDEALPLIGERDYQGLGAEARELLAWRARLGQARGVVLVAGAPRLLAGQGSLQDVSAAMAGALRRLDGWYRLADRTRARPIASAELRRAALAPASVARVRALFEASLARAFSLDGRLLVPEAGGEATLAGGALRFAEMSDEAWATARALAGRLDDPAALQALWDERRALLEPLDAGGVLGFALARWRAQGTRASPGVGIAAKAFVENAARVFAFEPARQFELVVATEWDGRYVGRWHTHPPRCQAGAWVAADVPSYEDMQNAVRAGQFLTIAFRPDGFELYDASALAAAGRVDLGLLVATRYRSPGWRRRFERQACPASTSSP